MNTLGVSGAESKGKDNIKVDNPFFAEKVMKLLLESSFVGPSQNQAEKIPLEKFNCN